MGLNFFEGLSLCFRNEYVAKDGPDEGKDRIDPKESVKSDGQVDGSEELEHEEGHGEVEAWDSGAEEVSHPCRKHLAQEQERDTRKADGVADHVDDEADKGDPFQLAPEVCVNGLGVAEEEEESADGGHRHGHHNSGNQEEDPSSSFVNHEDGHWNKCVRVISYKNQSIIRGWNYVLPNLSLGDLGLP